MHTYHGPRRQAGELDTLESLDARRPKRTDSEFELKTSAQTNINRGLHNFLASFPNLIVSDDVRFQICQAICKGTNNRPQVPQTERRLLPSSAQIFFSLKLNSLSISM